MQKTKCLTCQKQRWVCYGKIENEIEQLGRVANHLGIGQEACVVAEEEKEALKVDSTRALEKGAVPAGMEQRQIG